MADDGPAFVNEHVDYGPVAGLRPYVGRFTGYRQAGLSPAVHRGLPSPYLTMIFTLGEPLVMAAHPQPGQEPGTFEALVGGLHTSPALIRHDGSQSGIQLYLSPLGSRALLGMPAIELAGIDVHGSDIFGELAAEIDERLRSLTTWPDRFALIERVLLDRLGAGDDAPSVSAEVRFAWRALLRSGGNMPVSSLATETGWSERHLRNRFRLETGLAPKEAARVVRFHVVRRQLQRRFMAGERSGLADLAVSAGYFDQAHLDREFGQLAGCPPTTWLAEEFRNVQAAPGAARA